MIAPNKRLNLCRFGRVGFRRVIFSKMAERRGETREERWYITRSWEGALLDGVFMDFDGNEDQGFQREFSRDGVRSPASST